MTGVVRRRRRGKGEPITMSELDAAVAAGWRITEWVFARGRTHMNLARNSDEVRTIRVAS